MTDLAAWLLEQIAEDERQERESCRNPHEGKTDDQLHVQWAHPAYEYAQTEGQRKAWDGVDVPPEGDGWELNVTESDPEAFERFSYHEERYWRRLRPEGPREWEPPSASVFRLAECDAKRRIINEVIPEIDGMDDRIEGEWGMGGTGPHDESALLLKLLALPYADRPGYREEWRPDTPVG